MKKSFYLFAILFVALSFVACSSDDEEENNVSLSENSEFLYGEWQSTSRKARIVSKSDGSVDEWNEADTTWGLLFASNGIGAITEFMTSDGFPSKSSEYDAYTWNITGGNSIQAYIPVWRETRNGTVLKLTNNELTLRVTVNSKYEEGWYETYYRKVKDYQVE